MVFPTNLLGWVLQYKQFHFDGKSLHPKPSSNSLSSSSIPIIMSFPQPPDSNSSYDGMLHNVLSNNIDPTPSSSYKNDPPSTISLDPFCIPNSINVVQESYGVQLPTFYTNSSNT
ncbi:hypothetical protein O181_001444 [Austropuccinia psidii MF-1]|uniref:Uncharacterized protein n=1 Tax=Austropuccinia psidii MF-1 TaxID=1389203 RepID=A0A9Q3BAJ0_9BASI|nr:hypothetical protein [Austropuccinia psidii MF-1]